jgi:pilus assembly protein CpaE
MIPLPVVLVGIEDPLLSELRRELCLAGASVEVEFSHPASAIEALRFSKKESRLIVVHWSSEDDSPILRRLSETFSGWPILALVDHADDPHNLISANRSGVSQIVPMPWGSLDFQDALKQASRQHAGSARDVHLIAVSGAAGGSGTTMAAINLASEIAGQLGRETTLAEFNFKMGSLAPYLDAKPRFTLTDLIRQIDSVDDYVVKQTLFPVSERLRILAGPSGVHPSRSLKPKDLVRIVDCLKILSDVVVLDLPSTFDEVEFEVLRAADHVVLVGLQNVPSIRSLKQIRETLSPEVVALSLWIVINRYDPSLSGFKVEEIKQLLDVPRVLTIANDYHSVTRSINRGQTLRQVAPGSAVLADIDSLIFALLGEYPVKPETNSRGTFSRLFARQRA